jgi:hypothetical protein
MGRCREPHADTRMTPALLLIGLSAVLLILALAYDNRQQHHIWRDDD